LLVVVFVGLVAIPCISGAQVVKKYWTPSGFYMDVDDEALFDASDLDMDGDGYPEMVLRKYHDEMVKGVELVCYSYDQPSNNYQLEWSYTFSYEDWGGADFGGFHDIDDDGFKELVVDFYSCEEYGDCESHMYLVNWQTGARELIIDNCYDVSAFDIDQDGVEDLICHISEEIGGHVEVWGVGDPVTGILIPAAPPKHRHDLKQNRPNPFNPSTTIDYELEFDCDVRIAIYSTIGERVRTLVAGHKTMGRHTATWDGNDDRGNPVSSGVYFYQLRVGEFVSGKKMILIK
jgi:hypothetical protein